MRRLLSIALLCVSLPCFAQKVSDRKASLVDVRQRHEQLAHTSDARTQKAIASLTPCSAQEPVAAPAGRMEIPRHYLTGSHGPTNPEEARATRVYAAFEKRVVSGMNEWLVTGDAKEARCAQQQIDTWAQASALKDYDPKESSQSWYQVEWTLSSIAVSETVLLNEPTLELAMVKRDLLWMDGAARKMISFDKGVSPNNHHYWRALAATATGVACEDNELFAWGVAAYKQAIDDIDARGAFPLEMARHERAIHYQSFALQPLGPLAALAERQHVPLFEYRSPTGKTFADAENFLGEAVADPAIVKVYASEPQDAVSSGGDFFTFAEFYSHYATTPLHPAILHGLEEPSYSTRVGGSVTVLDGYSPGRK